MVRRTVSPKRQKPAKREVTPQGFGPRSDFSTLSTFEQGHQIKETGWEDLLTHVYRKKVWSLLDHFHFFSDTKEEYR